MKSSGQAVPFGVVIPGGGLAADGSPAAWVKPRLDAALAVEGCPPLVLLSAGTPYKAPLLNAGGFPITESKAYADYLVDRGCSRDRIFGDTWSLDTIGNAYFCRLMHCEPAGWRRLLIINSSFHMPRTRAIFDWIFSLTPTPQFYELSYIQVPNMGLDPAALAAREAKEAVALATLAPQIASIQTLSQAHEFIFHAHTAYRYARAEVAAAAAQGDWAKSY